MTERSVSLKRFLMLRWPLTVSSLNENNTGLTAHLRAQQKAGSISIPRMHQLR